MNEKDFLKNGKIEKPETKENLQIKKLKLQIEALEEKKKAQQQKQVQKSTLKTASDTLGGLIKIMLVLASPLFILGGFLVACASATNRSGRRRRF
jgi:hypothetical protein